MKIAILSKADASGGGASRVAEELAELLNTNGHTAHHYLSQKRSDNVTARSLYGNFAVSPIFRRFHYYVKRLGFPELIPWEFFLLQLQNIQHYDLLHFHDLSSAISPFTVKYLARHMPVVWTFHDCSPFTGGCLYPMGCHQYQTRCGRCPQLGIWPIDSNIDFTGFMQDIKRTIANSRTVMPIAPSQWMAHTAVKSGLYQNLPKIIPNGVDTTLFCPTDRLSLRKQLGLPADRPLILVIAAYIGEVRKGIHFAIKAISQIAYLNPAIVVLGHMDTQSQNAFADMDVTFTGYINDDRLKAHYMAASDVFLFTSLADNLPLVVLETMACGTPTVGFATGGVPEMVQHNHTGYLAPPANIPALVDGLQLAFSSNHTAEWGRNARRRAEMVYSHEIFLQHHLEFYETVVEKSRR
ncbi:MAG: glycosyltransferase [Anaerolineae bacterium]|nr:glycosyltransferase [Anaerolineae bacterium]